MEYKVGKKVKCKVSGIENYGVFVNIDNEFSGLIHISEVSEGFVKDLHDFVSIGEEINAKILEIDEVEKKLRLSIKNIEINNQHDSKIVGNIHGFVPLEEHLEHWVEKKIKEYDDNL